MPKPFEFTYKVEARKLERWRSVAIAQVESDTADGDRVNRAYAMLSDEPATVPGGEDTAPPPLAFFLNGVAF